MATPTLPQLTNDSHDGPRSGTRDRRVVTSWLERTGAGRILAAASPAEARAL